MTRVALDATAVPARLTGAGVYVARVLAGLAARDDLEVEAFCALGSAGVLAAPGLALRPVAAAGRGRPARIAWTQLRAGRAARRAGADLLHGVHYELPLRAGLPSVVTVHDLTLLTHPEWHEASKVRYFGWAMCRAVATDARVLCVSATTAADLAERLDVPADRVDVTPLATDLPHRLVLAGLAGWGAGELAAAVAASGVADRVLVPGYVPEADKAALLTGADVFAYPSRYEGFGLPVLEAMACATPVVTTTG